MASEGDCEWVRMKWRYLMLIAACAHRWHAGDERLAAHALSLPGHLRQQRGRVRGASERMCVY